MTRKFLFVVVVALMIFASAQTSQAVLNAVDPGSPPGTYQAAFGFFPQWYQDTSAIALDLCLSTAASVNGPMCVLLPNPGIFDPAQPIVFPTNFPDESFWFVADAIVTDSPTTPTITVRYVAALEAAFGSGVPLAGDQVSFARIRIIGNVTNPGTYVVTHPYGEEVFEVPAVGNRAIAFTRDIGVAAGIFTGALKGDIGPFLQAAATPGGTPTPIVIGTETFIGDPNVTQAVVGSPFGTNFLRVQGPSSTIQTDQFFLAGKVSTVVLPTPLVVDRTTYSSNATQTQIDVFAISAPTATLSFSPPTTPMGGDTIGRFFGQAVNPAALSAVTITANNPSNTTTISPASPLTDVVFITKAEYSISTGTLVIEASSSDETALPTLSYGTSALTLAVPPLQSITVTGLIIPPATVTVTSAAGGSDTEDVVVLP